MNGKTKYCKHSLESGSSQFLPHGWRGHWRPSTYYLSLIIILSTIILLNLNHILQFDFSVTTPVHTKDFMSNYLSGFNVDANKKILPPYFANPVRLFKPLPLKSIVARKQGILPGDFIYFNDVENWNAAPIVVEEFKLIFFTIPKVGCTVWKQLFRRIAGYDDWKSQDESTLIPHNPDVNGLKYLNHYTLEEATHMMTSPDWTRAMMVRDPKERFLSAFLDKAVRNSHRHIIERCCRHTHEENNCVDDAQSAAGFLDLISKCDDEHWTPQHKRVDYKYWPYIDHILHVENAEEDSRTLLQSLGVNGDAWTRYGSNGWGNTDEDGNEENFAIFQSREVSGAGSHATWAKHKVWQWFDPATEEAVERFYQNDYDNPLFNFTRAVCLTCL